MRERIRGKTAAGALSDRHELTGDEHAARPGGPLVPSTTTCAAPGPVPVAPCTTVAHGTLLAAVHGQPAAVETFTIVEPPPGAGE